MIKKLSVTKRKKETKNCSNYTKHTVDANKVCSYWSEKTKMFTFQMSEQELINCDLKSEDQTAAELLTIR